MANHARFSPSAAIRWVNCPGSVDLLEQYPQPSSVHADLGTFAHKVCESLLLRNKLPADVPPEMLRHCEGYADYVRSLGCQFVNVETRVFDPALRDFSGIADCVAYTPFDTMYIIDFKYGKRKVSPVLNWQLMLYAIGAMYVYTGAQPSKFRIVIYQPRVNQAPAEFDVTLEELKALRAKAIRATKATNNRFNKGEWCNHYCNKRQCHLHENGFSDIA